MRICLASDLHVDVGSSRPPISWPKCDVLLISGDVANSVGETINTLRKISLRTEIPMILHVPGNHENYSNTAAQRTVLDTSHRLAELMPPRCLSLNAHGAVQIGSSLYAVGATGWFCLLSEETERQTLYDRWRAVMNDDRYIGFSAIEQPLPHELALSEASFLEELMLEKMEEDPDAHFVVSTHYAPRRELLSQHPRFLATNPFYVNTHLEGVAERLGTRIVLWTYGHTHFRGTRHVGGVTYIANPRGYPGENPGWEPLVEEIET